MSSSTVFGLGRAGGVRVVQRLFPRTTTLPRRYPAAGSMRQAFDKAGAAQGPLACDGIVDPLRLLAGQAFLKTLAVIGLTIKRGITASPVVGMIDLP